VVFTVAVAGVLDVLVAVLGVKRDKTQSVGQHLVWKYRAVLLNLN
jgi:hypothetical protein